MPSREKAGDNSRPTCFGAWSLFSIGKYIFDIAGLKIFFFKGRTSCQVSAWEFWIELQMFRGFCFKHIWHCGFLLKEEAPSSTSKSCEKKIQYVDNLCEDIKTRKTVSVVHTHFKVTGKVSGVSCGPVWNTEFWEVIWHIRCTSDTTWLAQQFQVKVQKMFSLASDL